mmetsp:Transcript_67599/g.152980  ORF Transcript_67599/g.152980 Transcript_67599/m.152980 type:complete len:228 (-) Transcript_67599:23-706(-)
MSLSRRRKLSSVRHSASKASAFEASTSALSKPRSPVFSPRSAMSCVWSDSSKNFLRMRLRFACSRFRSRRSQRCSSVMARGSGRRRRFLVDAVGSVFTVDRMPPAPAATALIPAKPEGCSFGFIALGAAAAADLIEPATSASAATPPVTPPAAIPSCFVAILKLLGLGFDSNFSSSSAKSFHDPRPALRGRPTGPSPLTNMASALGRCFDRKSLVDSSIGESVFFFF